MLELLGWVAACAVGEFLLTSTLKPDNNLDLFFSAMVLLFGVSYMQRCTLPEHEAVPCSRAQTDEWKVC